MYYNFRYTFFPCSSKCSSYPPDNRHDYSEVFCWKEWPKRVSETTDAARHGDWFMTEGRSYGCRLMNVNNFETGTACVSVKPARLSYGRTLMNVGHLPPADICPQTNPNRNFNPKQG